MSGGGGGPQENEMDTFTHIRCVYENGVGMVKHALGAIVSAVRGVLRAPLAAAGILLAAGTAAAAPHAPAHDTHTAAAEHANGHGEGQGAADHGHGEKHAEDKPKHEEKKGDGHHVEAHH